MTRAVLTALLVLILSLMRCSSALDISGLYLCDDRGSGFLIEPDESGYRVTAVIFKEGSITETLFSYSIEKSRNNCYRLYTEPEKLNYYDVEASSSGFNGVYRNIEKQYMIRALLRKVDY
jgi:hypothetical protein